VPPTTDSPPAETAPTVAGGAGRVVARGLTRRFGATLALAPLDLDLGPGGVTGLLGPNGSGKSTLLRVLMGLVPPHGGAASVDGVALAKDGVAIRRRATYAPGEVHVYGEMRGRDHLRWLLRGRGAGALRRGRELCDALGLPLRARVRTYSHGMKRQLLFAAALAPDVRVRVLDEPTDGLDPTKRATVNELLCADAARGTTVLLSSHHLGEVDRACDRMLFLREGRLVADETAASVLERQRRVLRLAFDPDALAGRAARLERLPAARVRLDGGRAHVELGEGDPRAFLAALAADAELPPPLAIEYGQLSLEELYRDLYGVEGF
jgi:ABC-2 type transport system ATP-binding protein